MKRLGLIFEATAIISLFSACKPQEEVLEIEKTPAHTLQSVYYDQESSLFHATKECQFASDAKQYAFSASKLSTNFQPCGNCIVMLPELIENGELLRTPKEAGRFKVTLNAGKKSHVFAIKYYVTSDDTSAEAREKNENFTVVYVEAGKSADVYVHPWAAHIYCCSGTEWYGEELLFGVHSDISILSGNLTRNRVFLRNFENIELENLIECGIKRAPATRSEFTGLFE